jgi:hypothetical protein
VLKGFAFLEDAEDFNAGRPYYQVMQVKTWISASCKWRRCVLQSWGTASVSNQTCCLPVGLHSSTVCLQHFHTLLSSFSRGL